MKFQSYKNVMCYISTKKPFQVCFFTAFYFNIKLNQSVENAGVAFVKGPDERNEFFEKKKSNV